MEQRSRTALVAHFSALEDPRQQAKVLYPLPEIVMLLLCATLAGADDFVEMGLWGKQNLVFLRRFLAYEHGVPSHDTLGEVIRVVDPDLFRACFTSWVEGLREDAPDTFHVIARCRFSIAKKGSAVGIMRKQLPFTKAWALTINKSQGQTLDGLLLDATVPPFEHGHSYGALAPLYGVSSRRRLA